MTEKCQPTRSEEADRLVNEFLDQIVVRDASGNAVSAILSIKEIKSILDKARFPTIPDELRESLCSIADRAWDVDPGSESELLTRYLALPDSIRNGANKAYNERFATLSPIDKLKVQACKPDEHPTEATLVAKMYLDGRPITTRDAVYVGDLLEIAAKHGNAEAAYLLATAKVPVKHRGNDISLFLTNSEYLRDRYRRQAREGNFRRVFEDEANAQYDADDGNEDRLLYLQEKLAGDESCKTLGRCIDETETITPMDWMFVGEAYVKHAKHIEEEYEWLMRHCADTREQVSDLRNRAKRWLRKAARHETRACFLVAENFCTSQEERFSFLKSAAFPGNGLSGYSEATSPLACEFLLNPKSEHFDAEAGEDCLRDYLASCPQDQHNYLFLDDGNAANCLADWLMTLPAPTSEQKAEAFAWYKRAAEPEFGLGSPHALIRAGLMALRGEGCRQDHDLAKTFLKRARRSFSDQARDKRASKYADITLRLGWQTWTHVAEELLELAEETEFLGDPLCPLTPEDVGILVARNPRFRPRSSDDELRALRGRLDYSLGPFGEPPIQHLIVEGLVWALQPSRIIPRERLTELWGDSRSMVECYARSRLELASRISGSDMAKSHERVKGLLEAAISFGNEMFADRHREPLKFGERDLVGRIARQATTKLNDLNQRRESELKATLYINEQAHREAIESMMAMFAHKFRGPVDSILFNTTHHHDERIYVDAAHTMNGLLDIFSVVSTTPEKLASSLKDDVSGNGSPASVLLHSLKLALVQLLSTRNRLRMSPHYLAYAKRHGQAPGDLRQTEWMRDKCWVNKEIELQTHWEQEIGAMTTGTDIEVVGAWMSSHLLPIHVEGFAESTARFAEYGPKASLLTVIFTEVLVNAIKHATPTAILPLVASWKELPEEVSFTFANPSTRDSRDREKSKGSGRGHMFLKLIAEHIGGGFDADITSDKSWVSMTVPSNLMTGDVL
jgi:TPR repeat protein